MSLLNKIKNLGGGSIWILWVKYTNVSSVQWRSKVIHCKFIKPITMTQNVLRVRLVGVIEKCEERKLWEDGKVGE